MFKDVLLEEVVVVIAEQNFINIQELIDINYYSWRMKDQENNNDADDERTIRRITILFLQTSKEQRKD